MHSMGITREKEMMSLIISNKTTILTNGKRKDIKTPLAIKPRISLWIRQLKYAQMKSGKNIKPV